MEGTASRQNADFAAAEQHRRLERICTALLEEIGENPDRPGLVDTPRRWAQVWMEFIHYEPGTLETTFASATSDQMIVVSGMRVWSFCEHHLLPFWCDVAVAYIAKDVVIGLSKIARIAHAMAHKLQIQEQLGLDIAETIQRVTQTDDVGVLLSGEHLCMSMRGIKTPGRMTTSVMRGEFLTNDAARAEFLSLARGVER
jgi:GTP cyclohydrolase IA